MDRNSLGNSWWVRVSTSALPFGVVVGLIFAHRANGWNLADGLIGGVGGGLLFGLLMAWSHRRHQLLREQRADVFTAGLPPQHRVLAVRASRGGPIPEDRATRAVAASLVRDRLERTDGQRGRAVLFFAVVGVLELVLALTSSPWFWLAVALFVWLILTVLQQPHKLRRRLAQLNAG